MYGNTDYDFSGLTDPTGIDGNISEDPVFVLDPDDGGDGWGDDPDTPNVDEGANDDLGSLHLQSGSPCIDAGDNEAVPADTPDLDDDGDIDEPLPFDLAGAPRFIDAPYAPDTGNGIPPIVDMGAYEHQPVVRGDCDASGDVDLTDFAWMADCLDGPGSDLLTECSCADMDLDDNVDLADFAALQVAFSDPS
jgi:hypothetical protein